MRRIHVTGGQGSGKTTLTAQLAARLGVPAYDLDLVGWDERGRERPLEERLARVRAIAAGSGWVTEGTMLGWTDPLVQAADLIVWLDVPWRVAVWRMVTRHLRASLAGRNRHPGLRKLVRFIWYTRGYYRGTAPPLPIPLNGDGRATRRETAYRLAVYREKAIRCRHSAEVRALLADLYRARRARG